MYAVTDHFQSIFMWEKDEWKKFSACVSEGKGLCLPNTNGNPKQISTASFS